MEAPSQATPTPRKQPPIPWLNSMATEPFYLLHLLALFSYFAARTAACQDLSTDFSHHLLRREIQAVLALSVLLAMKFVKEENWEGFIADGIFYAKGFLLAVCLVIDYRLSLCYLFAFVVIFVVSQQPPYDGLGSCTELTPFQLESILAEGNTSRYWLIELRASTSLSWVRSSRTFAELSNVYSNNNLSFGVIDLGRYPNAASLFGVSLWGQIPTYILFDKSVEAVRFPDITFEAKPFSSLNISKRLLCEHFELDRHLVEYLSK
ncbi:Thioredoxin-related transmembrane protein 2 [Rhynchospora pubera]|uniref:Thioredoxin-related transmembrane protein 2 n=1 Tax=Rhynchospora pubera TaxID=906938 RepID=A0AAV8G152_9POAL|nr:Thioredoxin-related transmembrane protein 2 [Rhynchospora pubera]